MPDQCYFEGDFHQCGTNASTGESPTVAPAKWRKVQIPKKWRPVLHKLAYAILLERDGQKEKAIEEARMAREGSVGFRGLNDLVRDEATAEHWNARPHVHGRSGHHRH